MSPQGEPAFLFAIAAGGVCLAGWIVASVLWWRRAAGTTGAAIAVAAALVAFLWRATTHVPRVAESLAARAVAPLPLLVATDIRIATLVVRYGGFVLLAVVLARRLTRGTRAAPLLLAVLGTALAALLALGVACDIAGRSLLAVPL